MRLLLFITCACLCVVLTGGCHDATFQNVYSTGQEIEMGQRAADQIDASVRLDNDPEDNARVQRVAQLIFAQARKVRPDVPYQIRIIQSKQINAFSLPGGFVYIYTGLLKAIGPDDDALAAVIGHESAHVVLRHAVKQMSDAGVKGALVDLLGLTTRSPLAYNAAGDWYDLDQLHYSREDEYQADKYGLMFAYNAGYDPYGMVRLLEKLEQLSKGSGSDAPYAEDHPITRNRILRVEALIEVLRTNGGQYPNSHGKANDGTY